MKNLEDVLMSIKTLYMTIVATAGVSTAKWFGVLTDWAALMSTLAAIGLSLVVLRYHLKKGRREEEIAKLRREILELELEQTKKTMTDLDPINPSDLDQDDQDRRMIK